MRQRPDPFDRAVRREETLRKRASALDTMPGFMRLAMWWYFGLGLAWAAVVAAHWLALPDPRWLAVLHTMVFTLAVVYALFSAAFIRSVQRRRPDWFDR